MVVLLKEIVDALETILDDHSSFLDLDSGLVHTIPNSRLSQAEESEEEPEDLLAWEEETWEIARRIATTDRFRLLPRKFDVHEWQLMDDFSHSLEAGAGRDDAQYALHGAGAFRHFKAAIRRHKIEQAWYAFRDAALREIAIRWCEKNGIEWSDK